MQRSKHRINNICVLMWSEGEALAGGSKLFPSTIQRRKDDQIPSSYCNGKQFYAWSFLMKSSLPHFFEMR
ncbi:UNVERIFIED_CONTAM: hypothetical protein FKN15_017214 [Acipenser sinensis]